MRLLLIICCFSFLTQTGAIVAKYRNALSFINELRHREAYCKYFEIHLPEHSHYKPTPNEIVNDHLQKSYVKFLQHLRKLDYYLSMKRLVEQGLGTALPICYSFQRDEGKVRARWEANLLQPLFTTRRYLTCILREADLISCLERYAKEDGKNEVEVEMTITAMHFIKQAVEVVKSWWFFLDEAELNKLRSDESAIRSVKEWDRISTIPKVLYLKFILHGRSLISAITNNTAEQFSVSNLQLLLKQTLDLEFPNRMLIEVRREQIQCRVILNLEGSPRKQVQIEQIILVMVMQRLNIEKTPRIFVKDTVVYISVAQYYGEEDPQELERLFDRVVNKLKRNNYVLNINPDAAFLE